MFSLESLSTDVLQSCQCLAQKQIYTNHTAENHSCGWRVFSSRLSSAAAASAHTPHTTDRQTDRRGWVPLSRGVGCRGRLVYLRWSQCFCVCSCQERSFENHQTWVLILLNRNIQLQTTFTFFHPDLPVCPPTTPHQHAAHSFHSTDMLAVYASDIKIHKHPEKLSGQQAPEWPIFSLFSLMRAIKSARHQYFSALVRQAAILLFDQAHQRCFVFLPGCHFDHMWIQEARTWTDVTAKMWTLAGSDFSEWLGKVSFYFCCSGNTDALLTLVLIISSVFRTNLHLLVKLILHILLAKIGHNSIHSFVLTQLLQILWKVIFRRTPQYKKM